MKASTVIHVLGSIALLPALLSSAVLAQGEAEDIKVPVKAEWLQQVDLSSVPKTSPRAVGSGTCANAKCDGNDNDRCFESCGNAPGPEDIYGCPRDHHWALTFDDGPSNYTASLLDILDEHNVKATFCVMGSHVKEYSDILKRAYEAGHQIASHTYSHPHLMSLTNEQIINEMKATEEAIENAIGIKPKYVRPPFGEADDRVKAVMKSLGYKVLLWNVDPTDYDVYMLPDAPNKIKNSFRLASSGVDTGLNSHEDPGFISLQHDLYKQSIDQVPQVIEYLKSKGYKFMTVADCVDDKEPHVKLESEASKAIKAQSQSTDAATTDLAAASAPAQVDDASGVAAASALSAAATNAAKAPAASSGSTGWSTTLGLFYAVVCAVASIAASVI